jgi:hypothetical protein
MRFNGARYLLFLLVKFQRHFTKSTNLPWRVVFLTSTFFQLTTFDV